MPPLSRDELRRRRTAAAGRLFLRDGPHRARVIVHMGTCGLAAGAMPVVEALGREIEARGLADVELVTSGCAGLCSAEPMATVQRRGEPSVRYAHLTAARAVEVLEFHVLGGAAVAEYALGEGPERAVWPDDVPAEGVAKGRADGLPRLSEAPFFAKQALLVLRNKGLIDPERIDDALARDGYAGLERALFEMTPAAVVEEVAASGLRGRGGAGFPTGRKWKACAGESRTPRYVVGNCDEGDPGAFMDRSLLESDPHAVLEGLAIAGYAIGAARGWVYVRTEYPLAISRLRTAIGQARELGLLGSGILGSPFDFDVEIREGSGAFVCGEETSLLRSIEGAVPEPHQRPPFPVQSGLWGQPTIINNVETLATVPSILRHGASWFAGIGTASSKGTKIFSLVGKINNTGLIEVPMGITLREIVYEVGGGIPDGKALKAVQTGGPSGGCIPAALMDLPLDYEGLSQAGSIMGSGGMIVMDEDTCVVDVSRFFLQFTSDESCGKCSACRDGSAALLQVLDRISEGKGREDDLAFLEELCLAVKDASMCGLGQTLPNPVLSTLRSFPAEYAAHVRERRCPALVCRPLIRYFIDPDLCPGCVACLKACPTEAIRGSTKHVHVIDQEKCTRCGQCLEVCPPKASAVRRVTGPDVGRLPALTEPVSVKEWRARRAAERAPGTPP